MSNFPAGLHSLPEEVVGLLFELLHDDAASRKAFFGCTKLVRHAPSVREFTFEHLRYL